MTDERFDAKKLRMQYPDPRKPPVPGERRAVVPKKTARRLERFVMVPGVWKDRLLRAKNLATYRLALHVLVRHFETRGAPFILSNVAAELDGVTRRQKWRAIAELEALELIEVERRLRRSPVPPPKRTHGRLYFKKCP